MIKIKGFSKKHEVKIRKLIGKSKRVRRNLSGTTIKPVWKSHSKTHGGLTYTDIKNRKPRTVVMLNKSHFKHKDSHDDSIKKILYHESEHARQHKCSPKNYFTGKEKRTQRQILLREAHAERLANKECRRCR